jgi:hypothetical protein
MTPTMTPDVAVTRRGMGITIAVTALETKGRPLEAIRIYWENGGSWTPRDAAPPPRVARRRSESVPAR